MSQHPAARRRPSVSTLIALALIAILAVVTVFGAITVFQLPEPVTEQANRTNLLYQPVLIISFIIFFGVSAGLIWAIFRYRRTDNQMIPEQVHGSSVLEATWTIIPVIILVALFIPALILVIDLKTPPSEDEADVVVEAVGHQWWWEFIYPDDGIRIQQTPPNYDLVFNQPPTLVLPVDQHVLIRVRSTDVIHSFSAPNTLYKIQAIPGVVNLMHLKFEKTGTYWGQCYQFCGLRHSDMVFQIEVMEQADYNTWLREEQAAQGVRPAELAVGTDAR
jgi:cytochrome c oxidase subunit II